MLRLRPGVLLLCPLLVAQDPGAVDLVSQMTLNEKVSQLQSSAAAIPRLGIPPYDWWNEGLHGVARAGLATVFPQAIGLAATWDTGLLHRVADAISTEARGKYNDAQRNGDYSRYHGLTFWSPNINIFRDPRWGRGQETYGEDPYLTSRMAVAFITGMQGADREHPRVIATPKHFAVHSGPEALRHSFDAEPTAEDLENTYLPAFRASIVEAGAGSTMCAYNSVDGVPACANPDLLQIRLRHQWGFSGYVVSDCGAITDIADLHHSAATVQDAAVAAIQAGTDLSCGDEYGLLGGAVRSGQLPESTIDRALIRLFDARFRLGMFDPPGALSYSGHPEVALEAAEKSIVLLKNANGILPLQAGGQRIAVLGPAAYDPDGLLGNYNGIPSHIVTPLEGMLARFPQVVYAPGATLTAVTPALLAPQYVPEGFVAEYFDHGDLTGEPAITRREARVYFNWDSQDPDVVAQIPRGQFAVRWTGRVIAPYSGVYALGLARADCNDCLGAESAQLYVDDLAATGSVNWNAGESHELRVEYSQVAGGTGTKLVWIPPADGMLAEARGVLASSDVAVLFLGLNSTLEDEGHDRTDLELPQPQKDLLSAALDSDKPVIVVVVSGSAVASADAASRAAAVLEVWYPGQEAGTAIAATLAGDNNPAGRLPVTFYRSVDQLPPFEDYSMAGRTYRFFTGDPLYPFGFGLSYSSFEYADLRVSARSVSGWVTNAAGPEGDEVVQLYVAGELKGFERIHLTPGESCRVEFVLAEPAASGAEIRFGPLRRELN